MANLCKALIPLDNIERIEIYINKSPRKTLAAIKKSTGADYIINGTLYNMTTGEVNCHLKANGKVIAAPKYAAVGYAWNDPCDFQMETLPNISLSGDIGKKNYIACDQLIPTMNPYIDPARLKEKRGRSVIGIKNGCLALYCSKDGTSYARKPADLRKDIVADGWDSAIMLDGGLSSQCDFCGDKVTSSRRVQHLILVYLKKSACPYNEPLSNVKRNTKGNGARWVQWMLNYVADANLAVDGIFGAKSVTALKKFQKECGLVVDGICGKQSRSMLKSQFES